MPRPPFVLAALAAAALVAVTAPARPTRAAPGDWVGSEACGSCHAEQLAAWRRTAHARAGAADAAARGRCRACHATGDAPAGAAVEAGVGCEACHGAGAAYAEDDVMRDRALAGALGLRDLSTDAARRAACGGCHRGVGTRLIPRDGAGAFAVTAEAVH